MGDNQNKMKKGSLVKYINIDEETIYGVITDLLDHHKELLGPAVEVTWFDDFCPTYETPHALNDPEEAYIEVLSESR